MRTRWLTVLWLLLPVSLPATAHAARRPHIKVVVEGLTGDLRRNVLAALEIAHPGKRPEDRTPAAVEALHGRAKETIARALQPFGYYRPVVDGTLEPRGTNWLARYRVDAGPLVRVDSVDVQVAGDGAADPGFQRLVARFPLKKGDPLHHAAYERGKAAFVERAASTGFLDARFDASEMQVDVEASRATIVLHFDTGAPHVFGPVTFHQDPEVLRPELLQGYVPFSPGATFQFPKLLELQDALIETPYFQRVEVRPRRDLEHDQQVPIDVDLSPARSQRYTAGAGYGTDAGASGKLGMEFRRLNRGGHRAETNVQLSQIDRTGSVRYLVPFVRGRTHLLSFDGAWQDVRTDVSHSQTSLAGVTVSRRRGGWEERFGLKFRREDFTVGSEAGTSWEFGPEAGWTRTRADDRVHPQHGLRLRFDTRAAHEALLSDASFLQLEAHGKWIEAIAPGTRFLGRLSAGHTFISDFRKLPPTLRFFAGGAQSVRGYPYNSLGAKDSTGHVIGGGSLAVASVELERTLFGPWGVAVFYDAGNAAADAADLLWHGAGVGLRWASPVGPVRVDFAKPMSGDHRPIRIHLSVGPEL